jgi:hypothetical protein
LVPQPPRLAVRAAKPSQAPPHAPIPNLDSGAYQEILTALADNKRLSEWFTATVVDEVDKRAVEREARRERHRAQIIAVLGLIGVAGATGLIRSSIDAQVDEQQAAFVRDILPDKIQTTVDDRTADALEAEVGALRTQIRSEADFQQFSYLAVMLQGEQDGFSDDHRDKMMDLLGKISSTGVQRDRPEFPALLEKTIDIFASADLQDRVDKLVDLFPHETEMTRGIVFTLVSEYGSRLAARSALFASDSVADLERRFAQFEASAKSFHIEEQSLPYRMMIEFHRAGRMRSPATVALWSQAAELESPKAVAEVLLELVMLTDSANYRRRRNAESLALEELSKGLLDASPDSIVELLDLPGVAEAVTDRIFRLAKNSGSISNRQRHIACLLDFLRGHEQAQLAEQIGEALLSGFSPATNSMQDEPEDVTRD